MIVRTLHELPPSSQWNTMVEYNYSSWEEFTAAMLDRYNVTGVCLSEIEDKLHTRGIDFQFNASGDDDITAYFYHY